jgi:predicted ArsR family transcriptional regulator
MQRLDAVGDPDLRRTLLFARARPEPVTADDVAGAHGVHRNVARARLERLADAGLLIPAFARRSGRSGPGAGRPAKTYRVAPELSVLDFPHRFYERLLVLCTRAVHGRRLHELGRAFGVELAREARLRPARRIETGLERVRLALGRLGYQLRIAELHDDHAVLTTPTCPLRPLVRTEPQLAALDRGMWTGLVAAALPAGEIVCETGLCDDDKADCRIRLTLRRSDDKNR